MPIDTSIYSNLQTPQIQAPNPLQTAQQAMQLGQLGMQQMQMARQLRNQSAIQQAVMANTDPQSGQINQQGVLDHLNKSGFSQAAMELGSQYAAYNEAQAKAQSARADAMQKVTDLAIPHLEYLKNDVPDDQKPTVYHNIMQTLSAAGIPMQNVPSEFNQDWLNQTIGTLKNQKAYLDQQKTIAETGKTQAETAKAWSEAGNVEKTRLTEYQKMLGGDEGYKKASGMLTEGNNALALVDDATKNPGSAANFGISMARFMSGGQRLNETEMDQQMKAGAFGDKAKQVWEMSRSGTLTPQMADQARQLLTTQMGSAAKNKSAIENDYAGKYAIDAGLPQSVAYQRLTAKAPGTVTDTPAGPARFAKNGGSDAVSSANAASPRPPPNSLKMSDGKRTKWIPTSMKGKAIADGWSMVK